MDLFKCAHIWDNRQWVCPGVLVVLKDAEELLHIQVYTVNVLLLPMVALWWLLIIVQLVSIVAAALFILCCRVQQTCKHCKLKEVLQMRISHDSVPLWVKLTENTAELSSWLDDVGLSLPERGSHADG